MVHPPAIQDRIILISQAFVHDTLTQQRLIMEGLSRDVPLILLKCAMRPRKHIPTKRILHQLRQDMALCSSIQIGDSAWSNGILEHSVAKIAGGPRVLGRLLSGAPQPEWDALEKLEVVTAD